MADRKPYVLRRYDHGAYTVHDRATGEKVGRVIRQGEQWQAFRGGGVVAAPCSSRAYAAERLWETRP